MSLLAIRDLLQDEFALLQSDFAGEVFCYSSSLPMIGRVDRRIFILR
jgi:hypothetical protein